MSIKIYLVKFSYGFHFIMYINATLFLSNSIMMAVSLREAIVLTYAIIQSTLFDNLVLAHLDIVTIMQMIWEMLEIIRFISVLQWKRTRN